MPTTPDAAGLRWQSYWDSAAPHYDSGMRLMERLLFADSRRWACGRARGDVLEVAVGTGLNLEHYPSDVRLHGVDISGSMLALARERAARTGRAADLRTGDARALDHPDGSFDTVVCTFGLCGIPDRPRAVAEMARVLRPGGRLLVVDHAASPYPPVRGVQAVVERVMVHAYPGMALRQYPEARVREAGLVVEVAERLTLGAVARVQAVRPGR